MSSYCHQSDFTNQIYGKSPQNFFFVWREIFLLPAPQEKLSRATFLGTYKKNFLEPKEPAKHLLDFVGFSFGGICEQAVDVFHLKSNRKHGLEVVQDAVAPLPWHNLPDRVQFICTFVANVVLLQLFQTDESKHLADPIRFGSLFLRDSRRAGSESKPHIRGLREAVCR